MNLSSVQLTDVRNLASIKEIESLTHLSLEGNFRIEDLESTLLSFPHLKEFWVSVPGINGLDIQDESFMDPIAG